MSWKDVQYKDGKFKTGEGGGGGSSTFEGLDDVNFSNIQNGQVPKYNSTTQKWENANESGGGGTVTDVTVDGTSVVNQQGVAEITMPTPPTIPVTDVKVNGTSVVDANKEAQIKSYKEITQAEYNALPASKLNDGILYAIKDSAGADGFPPLIYSDEEREVGVWRDGKPLYQKTIDCGALPNNTTKNVNHNISNIDFIVKAEGYALAPGVNSIPIPFVNDGGATSQVCLITTNSVISLRTSVDRSAYTKSYVTLYYTKTTDTAGSGTWTTQGGYAHHYSTSEKVIGTWIDGKPIYECTFTNLGLTISTPNSWNHTGITITNLDTIVFGQDLENQIIQQVLVDIVLIARLLYHSQIWRVEVQEL